MAHHPQDRARAGGEEVGAPRRDTIAAVATAAGRGALGIVRLSGPQASAIATAMTGPLPAPRTVGLRHFHDQEGQAIDQGLVVWFPAPHSFTGEDVVELQGHGAPVVLSALVAAAVRHGARPARPGEFSERAYLNNRIDLAQAEAIADLIEASSVQAARAAQRSLEGVFSQQVQALVEQLIQLRIFVEGALDFSDEDIDWLTDAGLHQRLAALLASLEQLQRDAARGRRLREGLVIVLTGQPNVGKSTLLNRLAGTDAAIVTDLPGTTRDVLRENILLDGMPLTVVDTAGLRETDDTVEREGVRRAWKALEQAELALFLTDDRSELDATDQDLLRRLPPALPVLIIHNKCDLSGQQPAQFVREGRRHLRLSASSGAGCDALWQQLREHAGMSGSDEGVFSARARHLLALEHAHAHIRAAQQRMEARAHPELAAEELRLAQTSLDEITGRFAADDLLGRIFSQFCIGK